MARKRSKIKKQQIDPYAVLEELGPVTAHELIQLIHRVNPTSEHINSKKASERYKLKSRLQSLLIRRFNEQLLVEQPDPENPKLVGFRLRHFDEDACHAFINELDEDARSWTQRQIDEAGTAGTFDSTKLPSRSGRHYKASSSSDKFKYAHTSNVAHREEELSERELINLGRQALEEYDYAACEEYYHRAFGMSYGGLDAALCLLELFVDHMATYEKAIALSRSFSKSTKKDKRVKILLSLAAARCGRIDSALKYIDRVSEPSTSEVYLLAVRHFIQQGDSDRAAKHLAVLRNFEQVGLEFEIDKLEQDIHSLLTKSLEPVEQEMIRAWEQGYSEEALDLTDRLLSAWPQNKAALRIRHEFENQQRADRIDQLLHQADEAKHNNDFRLEADLLSKAITIGANADTLAERLDCAQNEANRQREEEEIYNVTKLWTDGYRKKALLQFIGLDAKQHSRIIDNIPDSHFVWLEQTISSDTKVRPEKLVEAVLVLGKSKEALQKGGEPRQIVTEMKLHRKALQSVFEADDILQQAETLSRTLEVSKTKDILDNARCFLATENLQKTRGCIDRINVGYLSEDDKKLFDNITSRLQRLERFQILNKKYIGCVSRGDHLTGRDIASQLAKIAEEGASRLWLDKMAEHSDLIKKEWSIAIADIDEMPVCYGCFGLSWISEDTNCCLLPDGRHIIIVTSHERWVFLRTFCLDDQKFKKAIIMRTPMHFPGPVVNLAGNVLWITDQDGNVLELSLEPINILSWHDFSDFVKEDEIVEGAWLFPKSRHLWLNKRDVTGKTEETYEIINLDQGRVVRKIKSSGFPKIINMGGEFRVAIQKTFAKSVQIYTERGKSVENYEFKTAGSVNAAALHPNGSDFVFLPYDDSGTFFDPFLDITNDNENQEGDFLLTIDVRPDIEGKNKPIKIENSHGELRHYIFTSLDTGLIFIYFGDNSAEMTRFNLAAYKPSKKGFVPLYNIRAPQNLILCCDEFTRQVVVISYQNNRLRAQVLDEHMPVFERDNGNSNQRHVLPSFDRSWWPCNTPTGAFNAASLAFMMQIRHCSPEERLITMRKMKQTHANNPDEFAAFIYALERMLQIDEAKAMKMWMREHYPDHYRVLIDLASEAAGKQKWQEVISLFEEVSRTDLDEGTACHICHLLGMSYFIEGDIKTALTIWEEGATYEEGGCDLGPYITYAKLSLMSAKKRKKYKGGNEIQKRLYFFETVDAHLANKKWHKAIEAIEKNNDLESSDLQILARLTEAYLHQDYIHGEMQWFYKVLVLADYCEKHEAAHFRKNQVLPPYIGMWSDSRLADLATQASQWLEDTIYRK